MMTVFLQTFNILQGTLPPLDNDLPEEYQRASEATVGEPTDDDNGEEEIQSGGDGGEVDATLPGKTHGQRRQA
jgi:hypothetical protein